MIYASLDGSTAVSVPSRLANTPNSRCLSAGSCMQLERRINWSGDVPALPLYEPRERGIARATCAVCNETNRRGHTDAPPPLIPFPFLLSLGRADHSVPCAGSMRCIETWQASEQANQPLGRPCPVPPRTASQPTSEPTGEEAGQWPRMGRASQAGVAGRAAQSTQPSARQYTG